jgi:hypothetical protein
MHKKIIVFVMLLIFGISSYALAGGDAGYKKGFYIKTDDGKFHLNINTLAQFRWTYFTPDIGDDMSEFKFQRLRPRFWGKMWHPDLHFRVEFDLAQDVDLTDAYFDYVGHEYMSVKAGQFYVPYDREQLVEPWRLQFVDRSIASDYFSMGRDIGFTVHKLLADGKFEYAFGIFNGNGPNVSVNDNNKYMYALRVGFYPMGYMKYSQCSMEDPDELLFGIGGAFLFDTNTVAMEDESTYEEDVTGYTIDVAMKYRGWSLDLAFYRQEDDPGLEGMEKITGRGMLFQTGYMFVPETFEVALRYAFVEPDKDIDGLKDSELTLGWNYFFRMHSLKFTMDYSYLLGEAPSLDDIQDHRIRMQFQYRF